MTYGCPNGAFTSFASLRIDGQDSLFAPTSVPTNLNATTNQVVQSINGINITQRLEIVTDASTGKSTLKIRYTVHNPTSSSHSVGIRLMIDTMVDGNDTSLFRTQTDGVMTNQREYLGSAIPSTIETLATATATTRVGSISLSGIGTSTPDRVLLANYNSISSTVYDATVNPSASLGDSAYAVYWSPVTIPAGESRTVVSHYGLGVGSQTLSDPPGYTTSYFIQYSDAQSAYNLGCQTHASMPAKGGIVTLIFGSPRAFGSDGKPVFDTTPIASYGTKLLPPSNQYLRISDLKLFGMWFVRGYQSQNAACVPTNNVPIVVVMGTSNSQICKDDKTRPCILVDNNALTASHAESWANMITDLNIAVPGQQVLFVSGYDAEFGPGWNSAGTLEWATSYSSNATASLYNFGDCNDCPRRTAPPWTSSENTRLDLVYKLAWQLGWAKPLPEIYLNSYQDEWYNVIRYGRATYPEMPPMILAGVMTDCQFTPGCNPADDTSIWTNFPYLGVEGRDNFPPKIGWRAMRDTLRATTYPNSNPSLIMMHHPSWLTDIRVQP